MVLKKQLTAQQIAELLFRKGLTPLFPLFEGLGKKTQIEYFSQLPELDEKVINHEKAKLGKLRQKLTLATKEYQLAKGKYESAKSDRKYQEYQANLDKVRRIENINQQRQNYERQLALYQQRKSEYEIKVNDLNNQINEIQKTLTEGAASRSSTSTNSISPYSGTIRRIKFLNQSPDGTITATISLMVRTEKSEFRAEVNNEQ